MRLVDGRRLTGLSRWSNGAAAAVVVAFSRKDDDSTRRAAHDAWRAIVLGAMKRLAWPTPAFTSTGAGEDELVWTATAPIDRLYAAVALCEAAARSLGGGSHSTVENGDSGGGDVAPRNVAIDAAVMDARASEDVNGDSALLGLQEAANAAGLPFLWCDDDVSVGWGAQGRVWTRAEAVAVYGGGDEVASIPRADLGGLGRIPVALITGTNGKTTTSRLLARIARCAGHHVGGTGTDGLVVDEQVVESGDWTGPGGARAVLRDGRVDLAVLEAARGGMLRRGLGTIGVDAAAVTNVSNDHLGEWGIDDVSAMAEVKLLVGRAVRRGGRLVLFDDEDVLTATAQALTSAEGSNQLTGPDVTVLRYRADPVAPTAAGSATDGPGRLAAWLDDTTPLTLVIDDGTRPALRIPAAEVPITIHGTARHNVANALCAALLARGLGISDAAITAGLNGFHPNSIDSPGRTNLLQLGGARIVLDFGHNPDGVRRVAEMAARLPATRRLVVTGQAGDRTNAEIAGLVDGLMVCRPDRWLLKSMPKYARGRAEGDVIRVLTNALNAHGVSTDRVTTHTTESAAVAAAIDALRSGDLLLLFVQADAAGALHQLQASGATEGWLSKFP